MIALVVTMMLPLTSSIVEATPVTYYPRIPEIFQPNGNNQGSAKSNHYQDATTGDVFVSCIPSPATCFTIASGGGSMQVFPVTGLGGADVWIVIVSA